MKLARALRREMRDPERRLMMAGLLDAGLSSLATFVIGVFAAHSLSPALLGGYALAFAAFSLAAIMPDAAVFTPLEVLVVQHPRAERLALLRHTLRTGFLAALLPALGVSLWTQVAPAELPREAVHAFTVTAMGCAILSPIQDHIRRMLHSGGASWLAAIVAAVQLLVAVAGVGFFIATDLPLWWAPFGVLGAANLVSMVVGLMLVRFRSEVATATPSWRWLDLTRSSGWMLLVGLLPAGSTFLVSALVVDLASSDALGYAETARVVAQPLMVLTMGLSATFSPKLVAAAQTRDLAGAQRLRRQYLGLVIGTFILYAALVSFRWAGNPMLWIVPSAYVVPGLAAIMLLSVFAQSLALPGRFEMLGAMRERELMLIEAGGNTIRAAFGGAAGVLGAFAIPFGVLALCVGRVIAQGRVLRMHYGETFGRVATPRRTSERAGPGAGSMPRSVPSSDTYHGEDGRTAPELDMARADAETLLDIAYRQPLSSAGATTAPIVADETAVANRPPLRVGVLLDEGPQPSWVADTLAAVRALPFCRVSLVLWIRPSADRKQRPPGWQDRLRSASRHPLYAAYSALDRWAFGAGPDPFASVRIAEAVADIPELRLRAETLSAHRLDDDDAEAIARAQLDVMLHLGSHQLGDGVLGAATHGVWWCAQDATGERPMLSGVWEVLERRPTTTLEMRVHDRRTPAGRIIDRSFLRTQRFSTFRNRASFYRKSITVLTLRLRELFEVGPPAEVTDDGNASAAASPSPARRGLPGNFDTLTGVAGIGTFALRRVLQRGQWPGGWFIAYQRDDDIAEDDLLLLRPEEFSTLCPPRDRFWADPFPVFTNGRHFIFFEEFLFADDKGHIAVTEIGPDGRCSPPVRALECDYHLSYPFVFDWQGVHYLMPETAAAGRIEVYRCTRFPDRWELHATMLDDIRAVDSTLVEWEGRWWMFANAAKEPLADASDLNEQLHLFHAPSPLGPWTAHRRNPVKWDARGSRPAGRLFQKDGELYRPAQDCTEHYGGSIRIQRVVRLDVDEYVETEAATIEPEWRPNLIGTHTINAVPGLAVIDGRLSYSAARRASVG
jgi:O-antigen/teichoic acid export membrane protein